ncbi:MAG: Tn7 transposase TnsA N-terminal domain-containing protein [Rhodoferax sp.]|nr:Tn7 transposase TnsA N-terminal domain-containing protein [Rhodoferax sp.]
MRTQKRFTPALIERFRRQGRGIGTFENYMPWHRVGRGDPSSMGRSHLMVWRNRQREMLSDGEWVGLLFSIMLNNLVDVREQFPLTLEGGPFELGDYDARFMGRIFPGTKEIARKLGFKHPRVHGDGGVKDWVMTTDQVLLLRRPDDQFELLALSYKPDGTVLTKRARQLLAIEAAYWAARSVQWLLITPDLFDEPVGLTLRRSAPWGLGTPVAASDIRTAVSVAEDLLGHSLHYTLEALVDHFADSDLAQRAFWQAVWCGALPLQLRRGWRPHIPLQLLDKRGFDAQNPVVSRRTAWN